MTVLDKEFCKYGTTHCKKVPRLNEIWNFGIKNKVMGVPVLGMSVNTIIHLDLSYCFNRYTYNDQRTRVQFINIHCQLYIARG